MKRIVSMAALLALLLSLWGCSADSGNSNVEPSASAASSASAPPPATPVPEVSIQEPVDSSSPESAEESAPFVYTLPLTEQPVTYTLFSMSAPPFLTPFLGDGQSYSTAESTNYVAETTGIRISYQEVDMFSFADQFNIMAASGDYTDMLSNVANNYTGGTVKALEDEIILDLTDYVQEQMPVYLQLIEDSGVEKDLRNDDGQYLSICSINNDVLINRGPILRKDWLDQLGLALPVTYDDWYEMGKAFLSNFDCSYAFYFDSKLNPGVSFSAGFDLPGFDITATGTYYYLQDGQVMCAYTSDNLKEYLMMLQTWYAEGLISKDFFNLSQVNTRDYFTGGSCGACWDNADAITEKNNDAELQAAGFYSAGAPLTVKEEGQLLHFSPTDSSLVGMDSICISTQCEEVDLLISFLDYMFTEPGQLICNYGIEGKSYTLDDSGTPQWAEAMYTTEGQTFMQSSATYLLNSIPSLDDVHANESMTYDDEAIAAVSLWSQGFDSSYNMPQSLAFTTGESEEYSALIADIDTYANEYLLRCVTGENDIEATWESYLTALEEMGLGRCLEIKQACYDRYLTR